MYVVYTYYVGKNEKKWSLFIKLKRIFIIRVVKEIIYNKYF